MTHSMISLLKMRRRKGERRKSKNQKIILRRCSRKKSDADHFKRANRTTTSNKESPNRISKERATTKKRSREQKA